MSGRHYSGRQLLPPRSSVAATLTALLSLLEPFGFQPSGSRQGALHIQDAFALGRVIPACLHYALPLAAIVALAGCGSIGIAPEKPLVTSVVTLPPVQIPVPVPCVDKAKVPTVPTPVVDQPSNPATPGELQRYYDQSKAALLGYEEYVAKAHPLLIGCISGKTP